MERNDIKDLELALGIHHPWLIRSFTINEQEKTFDIVLELEDKKRLFGLLGQGRKDTADEMVPGRWRYMNLGRYNCVIHAQVPSQALHPDAPISRSLMMQQAFLGHPTRQYSNYLRQQIALASIKGIDVSVAADFYQLPETVVKTISDDLKTVGGGNQTLTYMPTEVDPIWDKILSDKLIIQSNLLPLKLLVSKLKLAAIKTEDPAEWLALKIELRKFFVEHANQLEREIEQLCGITSEKLQKRARAVTSKQKLVLPALKNSVWLDLISGKLNLNSQSVPLNLLIARQRTAFIQSGTREGKIKAIDTVREYFRKNYRTLKPELLLLNRAMNIRQKSQATLPSAENDIWQRLLQDENYVPSNHIAYKLLLAKLRAQVSNSRDPVVKIEAARRIREFLKQNQKTMRQELSVILKRAAG